MTERRELYTAAWLLEIDKFIPAAEPSITLPDSMRLVNFLRNHCSRDLFTENVLTLIENFHIHKYEKLSETALREHTLSILLHLAHYYTDSGDTEQQAARVPSRLLSPFTALYNSKGKDIDNPNPIRYRYIDLQPLSCERESFFATELQEALSPEAFTLFCKNFSTALTTVDTVESLHALILKYGSTTSLFSHATSAPLPSAAITLFDQARSRAALALCLYDEYRAGAWTGKEEHLLTDDCSCLPPPCVLVHGAVSGIQSFIFDIPSKGAAKSLKARSVAVQLLTETCVRYILDTLHLHSACIINNSGGNFFLLVPACSDDALQACRDFAIRTFVNAGLSFALDWTPIGFQDIHPFTGNFAASWQHVREKVQVQKKQRHRYMSFGAFQPFSFPLETDFYTTFKPQLQKARGYSLQKCCTRTTETERYREQPFWQFGYYIELFQDPHKSALLLNNSNFEQEWQGFRFLIKDTPVQDSEHANSSYSDTPIQETRQLDYETLDFDGLAQCASQRTGTEKIGVLKMDIDNLGTLFTQQSNPSQHTLSLSHISLLSRSLQWFFEAYMQKLLQSAFVWIDAKGEKRQAVFHDNIYIVFSGGDDFFAVGAWDAIFDFALRIQEEFREFVVPSSLSLSASLLVVEATFPVVRFAEIAEEQLSKAKNYNNSKNRIAVFDSILQWNDYKCAQWIKDTLVKMIVDDGEPRSLIDKIYRSCPSIETGQLTTNYQTVSTLWHLAYALRDVGKGGNRTQEQRDAARSSAERILQRYELQLFQALQDTEKQHSPNILRVATRWAEFSTKLKEKELQEQYQEK